MKCPLCNKECVFMENKPMEFDDDITIYMDYYHCNECGFNTVDSEQFYIMEEKLSCARKKNKEE